MAVGGEDEMTFGFCRVVILSTALAGAALAVGPARSAEPLPGETFRDCEQCDEMVVVPAGSFVMGATAKPSQSPPHKVTLAHDFAIGRREVTGAEWGRCVAAAGCSYAAPDLDADGGQHAVTNLSWSDAKEYVAWMSKQTGKTYRLPTEAEWEYSARAGTATPYWWGKEAGAGHANCAECGKKSTGVVSVGSFRPNGFGLYDTSGNAAEWVEDCWNPSFAGAPANGAAWTTGDCSLRVLRGGSFLDKAAAATSAARFRYDYDVRFTANGFRVARDIK
jgi:formylglycine-generating enzyme required for sulfatase activity